MRRKISLTSVKIKIVVIYMIFGFLWILFSDSILHAFITDADTLTMIQTIKGWFYVCVTGLLVYLLLDKDLNSLENHYGKYLYYFDQGLVGIVITDLDGRVIECNNRAKQLSDCSAMNNIFDYFNKTNNPHMIDVLHHLGDDTVYETEIQVNEHYHKISTKKVVDPSSKKSIFIFMYEDITILKEMEKSLKSKVKSTSEELYETYKMRTLGEIATEITSEIGTPLGVTITSNSFIGMQADALIKSIDNGDQPDEYRAIGEAIQEAYRMSKSNLDKVSDMLEGFKSMSHDVTNHQIRHFKLYDTLNAIIDSIKPTIDRAKVQIQISCDETLMVYSYPGAINHILTNFILYGIHESFKGISIPFIHIEVSATESKLQIVCSDNGNLIDPVMIERLFNENMTLRRDIDDNVLSTLGTSWKVLSKILKDDLSGDIKYYENASGGNSLMLTIEAETSNM